MTPRRLSVAGAGAVGTALARGLSRAGWPLAEIACRSADRALERVGFLGAGEPVPFAEMCDPGRAPDDGPLLLLVSVPDRHIHACAARLAQRDWPIDTVALHLSGAVEVAALEPLSSAGLAVGGLHPLKSFVDADRDADSLAGTVAALEGEAPALAVARDVSGALGLLPFELTPGSRPAWHGAATHACNHLVALVDQALDLMESAGLDRDGARAALVPLLDSTVRNLERLPPGGALTGPIVRGDIEAVNRHLQAVEGAAADVGAAYRALARRAVRLARKHRDLDEDTAAELVRALTEPPR